VAYGLVVTSDASNMTNYWWQGFHRNGCPFSEPRMHQNAGFCTTNMMGGETPTTPTLVLLRTKLVPSVFFGWLPPWINTGPRFSLVLARWCHRPRVTGFPPEIRRHACYVQV